MLGEAAYTTCDLGFETDEVLVGTAQHHLFVDHQLGAAGLFVAFARAGQSDSITSGADIEQGQFAFAYLPVPWPQGDQRDDFTGAGRDFTREFDTRGAAYHHACRRVLLGQVFECLLGPFQRLIVLSW